METTTRCIKFMSTEGRIFELDVQLLHKSNVLQNMIVSCGAVQNDCVVPLALKSAVLLKIIEWLERVDTPADEFFNIPHSLIFDLIEAANYLDIPELNILACKYAVKAIQKQLDEEKENVLKMQLQEEMNAEN